MLPVKKQDTSPDELGSPLSGGCGRVLGSIQGLQQRLGDFSYGEVSIAEAKVKMLVKQLTLLHNSLDSLVQLKLKVTEIDRRLKAIPVENFDQVNQDDLAKHPQLHAILRASKLISLPNLIQAKSPSTSVTPGAAEERFSFTIPPQTTTASQDGGVADQTKDWSFDAKETPLTATDVSTTPLNFEFPGETEATAKSAPKNTA